MSQDSRFLAGRGAVVTGGGRGIGEVIAEELASKGASVVVSARSTEQIDRVASRLREAGHEAYAVACDVSDRESVAALASAAVEKLGKVDVLVNNAGVAGSAPLKALELDHWNHMMAVNATGTYLVSKAFASAMAARGWGRIVNIASVTSRVGTPYISAYTASKHAVLGFSRAIASELIDKGVTVNCICPGYVDTEMTVQSIANVTSRTQLNDEEALRAILDTVGQRRLIAPQEVAHLTSALCHEHAGGTTGQAIVMDAGGLLA